LLGERPDFAGDGFSRPKASATLRVRVEEDVGMHARGRVAVAALALVASAGLLLWSPTPPALASTAAATSTRYALARGLSLTTIRYPDGPNEVRILTIRPSAGPRLDVATARPVMPMWALTSAMSSNNGALAGVNGDFGTSTGAPSHLTMVDGELWTTGVASAVAFATSEDGSRAFFGKPTMDIRLTTPDAVDLAKVARWNAPGVPSGGQIFGYTRRGGSNYPPPGTSKPLLTDPTWCAARLVPVTGSRVRWTDADRTGITRSYVVDAQPEACSQAKMRLGSDPDAIVLVAAAGSPGAAPIVALTPGQEVGMRWSLVGWPGVTDVLGAWPLIVDQGVNVAPPYEHGDANVYWYNPRTAVGANAGCVDADPSTVCRLFVVTVDGRQTSTGWSKGMQLPALADQLLLLGAVEAVNLDGGGSTTMWVERRRRAYCESRAAAGGCLVNKPSSSFGERVTIEALTVLAGADPGTPRFLR
jgi:hypothetical protein